MPRVTYTAEQVDEVLATFARTQSFRVTERESGVDARTVRVWVTDKHAERYAEILEAWRKGMDERHVDMFNANVEKANEATSRALEQADDLLDTGDYRNYSYVTGGARNTMTVAGIGQDKANVLAGKPSQIVGDGRDAEDILRSLKSLGLDLAIDGTASEIIEPAELPPA